MNPEQRPQAKRQDAASIADDLLRKGADKALARGLAGRWQRRSPGERFSTRLIGVGLAIGPLGQGALGSFRALYKNDIPNLEQLAAVWWLFLITAPLAAFGLILSWALGKVGSVPGVLGAAAAASVLASAALSNSVVPNHLAHFYCYAEVAGGASVYEEECRDFNHAGFAADTRGRVSPSGAVAVFGAAIAYTVDARGSLMAISALLVSTGIGLLLREHT
jgi:hypothetical protein